MTDLTSEEISAAIDGALEKVSLRLSSAAGGSTLGHKKDENQPNEECDGSATVNFAASPQRQGK
jgi:hypothetical protein